MTALIFTYEEASKFPINSSQGGVWHPIDNSDKGYWLQLEAQADCDAAGIRYVISKVQFISDHSPNSETNNED